MALDPMLNVRRYWLSWEEPGDDPRPVLVPPPVGVVKWWCTGHGEGYVTICAVVDAVDDVDAKAAITMPGAWHPRSWRFCEPRNRDWMPPKDRFPT